MTMRWVDGEDAVAGTARIDSMRPGPTRISPAVGTTTVPALLGCGAATVPDAGATTTGGGADLMLLSVAHPAKMATATDERIRGSLFTGNLLLRP
jgi:hypothetical protein